jgi:hypothetical protein
MLMHALCYYDQRPHLLINGRSIPIICKPDLEFAVELTKDSEVVPPHKLDWFNNVFLPSWESSGEQITDFEATTKNVIYIEQIRKFTERKKLNKNSTKEIRETYLNTLYEFGLVEKAQDTRNKTRDVYWPTSENPKTSFISITSFDESCVRSCLEGHLNQRFGYEYKGQRISEDFLIRNVICASKIIPKNSNGVTA